MCLCDFRLFFVVLIIILQPMGPNGVAVKSNAPLKYSHADMLGLSVACRMRLIVGSVVYKRLSHINLGKVGSTPSSTEIKYALNVLIARSAIYFLWTFGGTSW